MAIKAGQIIHVGNDTVVVDRIQSAGPGTVNIATETIYELGNFKSIAQVRDIPDLSFALESYDVSTEIEAMLLGVDMTTGTYPFNPANSRPMDIKSVFKTGLGTATPFAVLDSVGLPYLTLEQLAYRFGLKEDARQTATLKGDSIYYNPGSTYIEKVAGSGTAGQSIVTAHPAYSIDEGGITRRVLNVMTGLKRLVYGIHYTETYGTVTAGAAVTTVVLVAAVAASDNVQIMYSSPSVETLNQSVHEVVSTTRPAAIRGRDVQVYLGGYDPANPYTNRLTGVQAATVDWRVQLLKDEEFGNYKMVGQDFDVPTVTGTVQLKPVDSAALVATVQKITGVTDLTKTSSAVNSIPLVLDVVLHSPADGSVLKRLHVPDARFSVPGFSARVQQKLDITLSFGSDTGTLEISKV